MTRECRRQLEISIWTGVVTNTMSLYGHSTAATTDVQLHNSHNDQVGRSSSYHQ